MSGAETVRVPREPTEAMIEAGWDAEDNGVTLLDQRHHAEIVWSAMIASAPREIGGGDMGAALSAADYLISLYERLWKGGAVRDLAEAISAYEHLKAAALTQEAK